MATKQDVTAIKDDIVAIRSEIRKATPLHGLLQTFGYVLGARRLGLIAPASVARKFFAPNIIRIDAGVCKHRTEAVHHSGRSGDIIDRGASLPACCAAIGEVPIQHFGVDQACLPFPGASRILALGHSRDELVVRVLVVEGLKLL